MFSGLEIGFPGNADCGVQRLVRLSHFRRSEAEHLALPIVAGLVAIAALAWTYRRLA